MERRASRLSRRQFVVGAAGLGLLAGCGRLPWQGQEPPKVARIGLLTLTDAGQQAAYLETFAKGLQELGYVEGHNIVIERRIAEEQPSRLPALVAELIQIPVALIVAVGTLAIRAARDATDTIPIVMIIGTDPVKIGLAKSLSRPDGNVTGVLTLTADLSRKRMELLRQVAPAASREARWQALRSRIAR